MLLALALLALFTVVPSSGLLRLARLLCAVAAVLFLAAGAWEQAVAGAGAALFASVALAARAAWLRGWRPRAPGRRRAHRLA